jgi:hypothetical protein
MNLQKSVAFLYTNNEETEKKYNKIILFAIASKKNLGINLAKDLKDFCKKNYKSLRKEIEDYRSWKDVPFSWIGRINIVKTPVLPKATYNSHQNPNDIYHRD